MLFANAEENSILSCNIYYDCNNDIQSSYLHHVIEMKSFAFVKSDNFVVNSHVTKSIHLVFRNVTDFIKITTEDIYIQGGTPFDN